MANLFLVEPGNKALVEGRSAHIVRRGDHPIIVVVAVLVMLPCVWFGLSPFFASLWLNLAGVTVSGRVIDRSVREFELVYYHIDYEYVVGDQRHIGYNIVTRAQYAGLPLGALVDVLYVPGDPASARLAINRGPVDWYPSAGLLLCPGLIYPLVGLWIAERSRFRRLEREGVIVRGEVTDFSTKLEYGEDGTYTSAVVRYGFRAPGGHRIEGGWSFAMWTFGEPVPGFGTPVAVLYLNDQRYKLL